MGIRMLRTSARVETEEQQRQQKELLFGPFVLLCGLSFSFYLYNSLRDNRFFGAFHIGLLLCFVNSSAVVATSLSQNKLPLWLAELAICGCTTGVLLIDWGNASLVGTPRVWALNVLGVDGLLVINASSRLTIFVLVSTLLMLCFTASEDAYRWGLYRVDEWSTPLDDDRRSRSSCTDLPCGIEAPTASAGLLAYSLVLMIDFHLTRRFAQGMRTQSAKAQGSVKLAEAVAVALSKFDLARAESKLKEAEAEGEEALPLGLHAAFLRLLQNLAQFQSYLPQVCFILTDDEVDPAEGLLEAVRTDSGRLGVTVIGTVPAPVGPTATICFTDIEGSTELWDLFPVGMQRALATHNQVLRECAAKWNGYECKTIGDAFMFAFDQPSSAVAAALDIQESLCAAPWPTELQTLHRCARLWDRHGSQVWGGLRVRAGIHTGDVHREDNQLTGRADYFGQTVNMAARIESASVGGAVCITGRVLSAIEPEMEMLGRPVVLDLGSVPMRGVALPPVVHCLIPAALRERQDEVRRVRVYRDRPTDTNSSDSKSAHSGNHRKLARSRTNSQLQCSKATFACITACPRTLPVEPLQSVSRIVAAVDDAVDRTWGTVVAVLGTTFLAAWGAVGRNNGQHAMQAARTSGMLYAAMQQEEWEAGVHYGAGSGLAMHGSSGSNRHTFVLALGPAVELAAKLAAAASFLHVFALVAGSGGERCVADDPSTSRATRAVDVWHTSDPEFITVYQLDAAALTTARGAWTHMLSCDEVSSGWGNDRWRTALVAARVSRIRGDDEQERTLAEVRQLAGRIDWERVSATHTEPVGVDVSDCASSPSASRGTGVTEVAAAARDAMLDRVADMVEDGRHTVPQPITWECPVSSVDFSGRPSAFCMDGRSASLAGSRIRDSVSGLGLSGASSGPPAEL
eukprot:TRINITY_DN35470_c0_g1_i1.p1 TRINITY_DN35470_c0_g1~~TRINITY_DN35470_c0_g1_i1.p1  ORF type:complete len:930 (+),score=174.26 TRINITY_DN35470_c0_g1_i1:54-2792(+)